MDIVDVMFINFTLPPAKRLTVICKKNVEINIINHLSQKSIDTNTRTVY